tara:strand:- start:2403 stop:3140 length:738 start_codon:yes stop_codon:yes gene_type:complete
MNVNETIKKILLLMIIVFSVSCCGYAKHKVDLNYGASFKNVKDSVFFIYRSDFMVENNEPLLLSQSSGTGTAVSSNKNYSDVLTAGHVCIDYYFNLPDTQYVYQLFDFDGNEHDADLIAVDFESDLCLLRIYTQAKAISVSNERLESGDYVQYSGYPMGLYMPENLHHFTGFYSGTDKAGFSMFSLAVTGGSSGSSVINSDGEIVGVISSVTEDFAHLVLGPGVEKIKTFLFLSSTCEKYCIQKD